MTGPLKRNMTTVLLYDDERAYIMLLSTERRVSMAQIIRECVRDCMSRDSANHAMTNPSNEQAAD